MTGNSGEKLVHSQEIRQQFVLLNPQVILGNNGRRPKMPMYDYRCEDCDKTFEIYVPLDKLEEEIKCPYCKKPLKKEMSPVFFKVN